MVSAMVNHWKVPAGRPTLPLQVKVISVNSVTLSKLGDTSMTSGALGTAVDQTERERERQTDRDRDRERQRETERDRERE